MAVIIFTVLAGGWAGYLTGSGLLMSSAGALVEGRQRRRRERLFGDQAPPPAGDDVLTLATQGRKIEAIRRYRQRHPGVGLREAKQVVDDCAPGGQRL